MCLGYAVNIVRMVCIISPKEPIVKAIIYIRLLTVITSKTPVTYSAPQNTMHRTMPMI